MPSESLVSYAQNGEDIVLWRALGHVHGGVYVDVGGWNPDVDSVTRLFYERGWRGVTVEPVAEFAQAFRDRRPRDETVEAAVTDGRSATVTLHRFGSTGLSTLDDTTAVHHAESGFDRVDVEVAAVRLDDVLTDSAVVQETIHFLKVDVEGAEAQVLAGIDLQRWRPWVLVVEATEPNSTTPSHAPWEPSLLAAGYEFTLFDGLSRYYVDSTRSDRAQLAAALSYPACPLDDYRRAEEVDLVTRVGRLSDELQAARRDTVRWRNEAVAFWADAMAKVQASENGARLSRADATRAETQLHKLRGTVTSLRVERDRLRTRVARQSDRIDRLTQKLEDGPGAPPSSTSPVRRRLRTLARRGHDA